MKGQVKSADGVSIAYRVEGSGSPTLVFVHGWCCDKRYWEPQVSHFAQKYRVVAIDLAGHGESGLNRDRWTVPAFSEDVAAVVNHLAPEQVVLIAHSMAPAIILEATQRINGVAGIVGVDSFHDVNQTYQASLDRLAALRVAPPEVAREAMLKTVAGMFVEKTDPALVQKITSDMCSAPLDVNIGTIEGFLAYDFRHALEKVKVPVRCIASAYRPFNLEAARQHCPSFEVVSMSGVGHFVMLEDPATFNGLLEGIIQDLVAQQR